MSLANWCVVFFLSVATMLFLICVALGVQAVVVETGRAINQSNSNR